MNTNSLISTIAGWVVRVLVFYCAGFLTKFGIDREQFELVTVGVVAVALAAGWSWIAKRRNYADGVSGGARAALNNERIGEAIVATPSTTKTIELVKEGTGTGGPTERTIRNANQ